MNNSTILLEHAIDILKPQMEKIDYLESIGFEFYENENSEYKPFGWKRRDYHLTYDEFISNSLESLKAKFEIE